jgi:hypothetical protein
VCDKLFSLTEVPAELRDCFEELEVECGAPWVRVIEKEAVGKVRTRSTGGLGTEQRREPQGMKPVGGEFQEDVRCQTLGWRPSCKCPPAEPRPGRVLDPFAGSSRTGLCAVRMGLDFTGIELHPDYASLSRRLLSADMPLFQGGPHA